MVKIITFLNCFLHATALKIATQKQLITDLQGHEDPNLQFGKPKTAENFASEFGKDCEDPQKPKVAVLFYGMYRTFGDQEYESSRLRYLLEPLKSKGTQGITNPTADLFAHVKTGVGCLQRCTGAINVSAITAGMEKSQVVSYVVEEGDGKYGDEEDTTHLLKKPECFQGKHTKANSLQHPMGRDWSIKEAHRIMEEHEEKMKQQYDVVLFSRADLHFTKAIDLNDVNCNKGKIYHDMFVALPRKYSHLMRDILVDFYLSEEPFACGNIHDAEDVWQKAAQHWQKKFQAPITYTKDTGPGDGSHTHFQKKSVL